MPFTCISTLGSTLEVTLQRSINSGIPLYYCPPEQSYLWFGIDDDEWHKKTYEATFLVNSYRHPLNYNLSKIIGNNATQGFLVELNLQLSDVHHILNFGKCQIKESPLVFLFDEYSEKELDAFFHIEALINNKIEISGFTERETWRRIQRTIFSLKFFGKYHISKQGGEVFSEISNVSFLNMGMDNIFYDEKHEDALRYGISLSSLPSVEDIDEYKGSFYKVDERYKNDDYKLLCDLAAFAHLIYEIKPSLNPKNTTERAKLIDEYVLKREVDKPSRKAEAFERFINPTTRVKISNRTDDEGKPEEPFLNPPILPHLINLSLNNELDNVVFSNDEYKGYCMALFNR
ncbi:hypothetical protein [Vibrio sp. 1S139]|uniref:hypothetical protein n=1 Tax=Vibrio sp. 1S139 TaxID=3230006 RepID=UPI00352ED4F3